MLALPVSAMHVRRAPRSLFLAAAFLLSTGLPGTPAQGMTLVRCKIDGKTVFSDTDCPRATRSKNAFPVSKPIRIGKKAGSHKRG